MNDLGKVLVLLGSILLVLGLVLMVSGRLHIPVGRLPGDIIYRGRKTTVYFPWVTSILLSLVLTVIVYLIGRFRR